MADSGVAAEIDGRGTMRLTGPGYEIAIAYDRRKKKSQSFVKGQIPKDDVNTVIGWVCKQTVDITGVQLTGKEFDAITDCIRKLQQKK